MKAFVAFVLLCLSVAVSNQPAGSHRQTPVERGRMSNEAGILVRIPGPASDAQPKAVASSGSVLQDAATVGSTKHAVSRLRERQAHLTALSRRIAEQVPSQMLGERSMRRPCILRV